MAGYIFSISKDGWNNFCNEHLNYGYFTPLTPEVDSEKLEKEQSRKATNKILAATFGDIITMKPHDNVYFLSNRKIYGVGELINIGDDCKYDNYQDASMLLPDCQIRVDEYLTHQTTRARWVCFFKPAPYFFKKGADMDDILQYRPDAFKMLRAFEGLTFIKIDDEENRALKEYISLINEFAYEDITRNSFPFSEDIHNTLASKDLSPYVMDLNKVLTDNENKEFVISEMFIEAALLQILSRSSSSELGFWDYCSHQLIASPFKPLSFIDKIDVFGYRFSEHYQGEPKLITKFLIVELKKGKVNAAALEQTMQYVDWICNEYASGDYSRIKAFVVGDSCVRNIESLLESKCQRDFIIETHPVKTQKWNDITFVKYTIDSSVHFETQ